ncbi:MAG: rhodanese-like domain-containing protein [Bacillaceae bacterium]|nr:rhodanese-like domain-containing protein [Bacillaceae bacterium]
MITTMINILAIILLIWFLAARWIPTKGVKQITTADLKKRLNEKQTQFVDVRTPQEYRANHIHKFENIPLNQFDQTNTLNKEHEVVVICQSGMRSNKASKLLRKQGFTHVTNVKGGMTAWN